MVSNGNPANRDLVLAQSGEPELLDDQATREREKYRFIWTHDAYRQTSFGLLDADKVGLIEQFRKHGVRTVLDAGCGTGKLMQKLITQHRGEFEVRGFDISNNCLDPFFDGIKEEILTVGCLWNPDDFQRAYDGVVCTDVLEHIPTDKVPAVLGNLARCTRKFCYLAIALFPDRFGPELIGSPLHLTVKEPEWWCTAIERAGFRMEWQGVERHPSGQNMWLHAFVVPLRDAAEASLQGAA